MRKDTVLKEAPDLCKAVRWELLDIGVVAILGIVGAHSDYFVVLLALSRNAHATLGSPVDFAKSQNRPFDR